MPVEPVCIPVQCSNQARVTAHIATCWREARSGLYCGVSVVETYKMMYLMAVLSAVILHVLLNSSILCYATQVDPHHFGAEATQMQAGQMLDAAAGLQTDYSEANRPSSYNQQQITQQKLAATDHLVQWLLANNAKVNVAVQEAELGAGLQLVATKSVQQGGTLLSLPTDLGFSRKTANGVMDFLLDYLLDKFDPDSPRALMWATTPRPHELRHLLNFPSQYLPLLQHPLLEDWLGQGLHHDIGVFYRLHADVLEHHGISYGDVVHAMGLIGTRTFNKPEDDGSASTFYALPLLDMANHDNACPHYNTFRPCEFNTTRECVYLTAGADVAAGQAVCFFYGYLLQDRALLEYGFLQHQSGAVPELFGIDRHDFDLDNSPLAKLLAPPEPFTGHARHEVVARIVQLQRLLAQLESGKSTAIGIAAQGPAPGDADGYFL